VVGTLLLLLYVIWCDLVVKKREGGKQKEA
jgi:hypothetical protein